MQPMPQQPKRTKSFRQLQAEWQKRLADSGFVDHEYRNGALKQPDLRSKRYEDREAVSLFFHALDEYLCNHRDLPRLHRTILEMLSAGEKQIDIAHAVGIGRTTLHTILVRYRKIITIDKG